MKFTFYYSEAFSLNYLQYTVYMQCYSAYGLPNKGLCAVKTLVVSQILSNMMLGYNVTYWN
jgi:hypothetical protein